MLQLSQKQQKIVIVLMYGGSLSSSQVHRILVEKNEPVSLVTVKRTLTELVDLKVLNISGAGRSTVYAVSTLGRVFADIDAHDYCAVDPDNRYGMARYNFDLFSEIPTDLFSEIERQVLDSATEEYLRRIHDLPESIRRKELERLIIELSWKSSKIEGNTYSLLDTENLILRNIEAPGKTKDETQMILNHKSAFEYVHRNSERFKTLTKNDIEELHRILVKNLGVGLNLRKRAVGITGSIYRPLDNEFQIDEALHALTQKIGQCKSPYTKALLAVVGISYIQPFEDGNKRTSRLLADAILLAYHLAPLSYRSVSEQAYREAILVFYELNSVVPFKNIFIAQYDFAARNYAVN